MATPANITTADLKGFYAIDISQWNNSEIAAQIVKLEAKYLKKLLGNTLYSDYIANPTATKWTKLTGGSTYTDYDGQTREWTADEFKDMLKGFIYFELIDMFTDKQTITGYVRSKNENSERVSDLKAREIQIARWNLSVELFRRAYNFMYCTKSTYSWSDWQYSNLAFMNVIDY